MTGKVLNQGVSSALVLIFPIAVIVVLVLKAWLYLVLFFIFLALLNLWQTYRWKQQCQQIDPFFYALITEHQGYLTPIDLAVKANLSATAAEKFLAKKAQEYGAQSKKVNHKVAGYYFLTANALKSIFEDSEPLPESDEIELSPQSSAFTADSVPSTNTADISTTELISETSTTEEETETELISETPTSETELISETPTSEDETNTELISETPTSEKETDTELISETPTSETELTPETPTTELTPETPTSEKETNTELISETPTSEEETNTELISETPTTEEETETELISETPTTEEETETELISEKKLLPLTQVELAKRLNTNSSTIRKKRGSPDFPNWSQSRDPEGISWRFSHIDNSPKNIIFEPIIDSEEE